MDLYNYKARVIKVIDGDTVKLDIDLGFRVHWTSNCRIAGINAPEVNTEEGKSSKTWLEGVLVPGDVIMIKSVKLDKYGRPIFDALVGNRDSNLSQQKGLFVLSEEILKAGHAVKY